MFTGVCTLWGVFANINGTIKDLVKLLFVVYMMFINIITIKDKDIFSFSLSFGRGNFVRVCGRELEGSAARLRVHDDLCAHPRGSHLRWLQILLTTVGRRLLCIQTYMYKNPYQKKGNAHTHTHAHMVKGGRI